MFFYSILMISFDNFQKKCNTIITFLEVKEMKRDAKINQEELEKKGFEKKGFYANCMIFGKKSQRILWNPETKKVNFTYNN